jgi:uncharacterized protein (DUF488 family)
MSKQPPPQEAHWPEGAIFTVGHSTLPIEQFIALMHTYGITCVSDIRTVPRSRHNPQFNGDSLGPALKPEHIDYVALPTLGGLRHARKDSPNSGWRNKSFRGYADYMQTEAFAEGLATLIHMSRQKRTAIMCAEAVPWRCHRSLIADALTVRKIPVHQIMSRVSAPVHEITSFAVVKGNKITYPPKQQELFASRE